MCQRRLSAAASFDSVLVKCQIAPACGFGLGNRAECARSFPGNHFPSGSGKRIRALSIS